VKDVIFTISHFATALLRNIPYMYLFSEKRSAGMKFRYKKEVPVWCTGPFQALDVAQNY
jgi:hypothetical protein